MTSQDIANCLSELRITPKDAADLLSVDGKTVKRWLAGEVAVPGPAEQAIRAWVRFQNLGLAWRPDGLPIDVMTDEAVAEQILRMRDHIVEVDDVIQRVRERGGVAAPWQVDLKRCTAELAGVIRVHFIPLRNGLFARGQYSRRDNKPDSKRDWRLLEDAIASFAEAVAQAGPNWINAR